MPRANRHAPGNAHALKTQRTLVLIKPDGVQRHLVGEIIGRFERAGLKIVGVKLVWATPDIINRHYRDDPEYLLSIGEKTIEGMRKLGITVRETPLAIGRRVRSYLSRHLSISPVVAMVLQGTNAIQNVRQLVGSTDPILADIGSVRGDLTIDTIQLADIEQRGVRNLVHASGDPDEAAREISIWFGLGELHEYRTVMDVVLHDESWDRPPPSAFAKASADRRLRPASGRRPAGAARVAKAGLPTEALAKAGWPSPKARRSRKR